MGWMWSITFQFLSTKNAYWFPTIHSASCHRIFNSLYGVKEFSGSSFSTQLNSFTSILWWGSIWNYCWYCSTTEGGFFRNYFVIRRLPHSTFTAQHSIGKLIKNTRLDDALMEKSTFGIKIIESVTGGSNYDRALRGLLIREDELDVLKWKEFWKHNKEGVNHWS